MDQKLLRAKEREFEFQDLIPGSLEEGQLTKLLVFERERDSQRENGGGEREREREDIWIYVLRRRQKSLAVSGKEEKHISRVEGGILIPGQDSPLPDLSRIRFQRNQS